MIAKLLSKHWIPVFLTQNWFGSNEVHSLRHASRKDSYLILVSGHSGIEENENFLILARKSAWTPLTDPEQFCGKSEKTSGERESWKAGVIN